MIITTRNVKIFMCFLVEMVIKNANPSLTSTEKHSCESMYYSVLVFFVIDLCVIFSSADQFFGSTGSRINLQRLINRH